MRSRSVQPDRLTGFLYRSVVLPGLGMNAGQLQGRVEIARVELLPSIQSDSSAEELGRDSAIERDVTGQLAGPAHRCVVTRQTRSAAGGRWPRLNMRFTAAAGLHSRRSSKYE